MLLVKPGESVSLDKAFEKIINEKEAALLRPAASQVGAALKEYNYLEIYVFPSIDSLLAAGIAVNVLLKNNMDFTLSIRASAPRELAEPSLLLGYPAQGAQEIRAQRPSALIGIGEKPPGLLHVAVTSSSDSSIAALTAAVFSELTVVGYPSIYGLVAGYWRGLDKGKKASFIGIEASIAEMLKLENKVEELFSLKLFRWPEIATEEAMVRTLDPYLPGLSGDLDACTKLLKEDPRLVKLLGKRLEEAPEQSIATLGEKLYELLKKKSKGPRRPTDVIGISYYSQVFPLRDLREAVYVLSHYAARGYAKQLSLITVNERVISAAALYLYTKNFLGIVETINKLITGNTQRSLVLNRVKIKKTSIRKEYVPIAERVLRQLGYLGEQEILGTEAEEGLLALAEDLLQGLGPGSFLDYVARGCIEYLEGTIFAKINEEKCRQ